MKWEPRDYAVVIIFSVLVVLYYVFDGPIETILNSIFY